ncbi:hypothetical protein [uncultured Ramlibacter sp.]|uniref:hypothetical protein n=1 Tax=uncultured Ramlibacter sp. TaxID=260755 RepID=UPI00261796BB|nr:hypothetical protein [uncultured Ramlibacter sp.]
MCPIDPSPHFSQVLQPPPDHEFPQAKVHGKQPPQPDVGQRPALPIAPEKMAVDVEDEDEDPVIDSGPGIADGLHPLRKQRG